MLSERSKAEWDAYVAARSAQTTPFGHRDELHRFLAGIHLRGESLTAGELGQLLDQVTDDDAERDSLTDFVEQGLALLQYYDHLVSGENGHGSDGVEGWLEL